MAFTDALADLFTETVTIAPVAGHDSYGKPTYGAPVAYQARIQGRPKLVRGSLGQTVVSAVTVFLREAPAITDQDQVTLPAPYLPSTPLIVAIDRSPDETGRPVVAIHLG